MQERDSGAERRRAQEDAYFRERDRELIDRQRQQIEEGSERRAMAGILGLRDDDPMLDALLEVGFKTATVGLLDLVPLVEVAWADGNVSARERDTITAAAARRRLVYGSAHTQLSVWLKHRPPENVFDASRRTLRRMLQRLAPEARSTARSHLLDECAMVASASGGLLGWGSKVGAEEQHLIRAMTVELDQDDQR